MAAHIASLPEVADGHVCREDLPLPVVHYPRLHGTFLAFAPDGRSVPALCACMRPAVESLLRLRPSLSALSDAGSTPGAFFPASVARRFHAWSGDGPAPVRYAFGVCHRCNATVPTLRYCEERQDSSLQQYFGWYVSQAYLRLGILPYRHAYLAEVCPPGVQAEIEATRRLEQDFRDQCSRLLDGMPPASCNVAPSCGELEQEDVRKLVDLRQRASTARRALKLQIEALVAQDVGQRSQSLLGA